MKIFYSFLDFWRCLGEGKANSNGRIYPKEVAQKAWNEYIGKQKNMSEKLGLRMYSLVLYQLSGIQAGIQAGHANDEYGVEHGSDKDSLWYEWAKNHKTVVILNGGTSTTLSEAILKLHEFGVKYSVFKEPDLYGQATAVSFILDERVYDTEKYPSFKFSSFYDPDDAWRYEEHAQEYLGGLTNALIRDWVKKFRLAG